MATGKKRPYGSFVGAVKGAYGVSKRLRGLASRTGLPLVDHRVHLPKGRRRSVSRATTRRRGASAARKRKTWSVGYMGRGFKKPYRATLKPNYYVTGAVSKIEQGSVVQDDNCVFVGHSTNANNAVFQTVWVAILKELLYKAGVQVQSFQQVIPNSSGYAVSLDWFPSGVTNNATSTITFTLASNGSVDDMWNGLYAQMKTRGAAIWQVALPVSIRLHVAGTDLSFLPLRNSLIQIETWSLMTIQNRTKATATATEGIDESALSVQNNPLVGRVYETSSNGFLPNYQIAGQAFSPLIANKTNGNFDATESGAFGDIRKPPQPFFFHGVKSRIVRLNPGEIKKDFIRSTAKMTLERFMDVFNADLTNENQSAPNIQSTIKVNWGKSRLYAFEKVCNTRADEPDVIVGYETVNVQKAKLITKRVPTRATMIVN
jgi:hypothetical protein